MNIQRPQHLPATNDRRIDKPVNEPSDHHGHQSRLNSTHSHNSGTQCGSCTARECPHWHTSERFGINAYTTTPNVKTLAVHRNTVTASSPTPTTTAPHTRAAEPPTGRQGRDASRRLRIWHRLRELHQHRMQKQVLPTGLLRLQQPSPTPIRDLTLTHRKLLRRFTLVVENAVTHRPPPESEWPAPGPCCETGAGRPPPPGGIGVEASCVA